MPMWLEFFLLVSKLSAILTYWFCNIYFDFIVWGNIPLLRNKNKTILAGQMENEENSPGKWIFFLQHFASICIIKGKFFISLISRIWIVNFIFVLSILVPLFTLEQIQKLLKWYSTRNIPQTRTREQSEPCLSRSGIKEDTWRRFGMEKWEKIGWFVLLV